MTRFYNSYIAGETGIKATRRL